MSNQIGKILDYAVHIWASDIHISDGKSLILRVNGELIIKSDSGVFDTQIVSQYLSELLLWNTELIDKFLRGHDLDFAFLHNDGTSFRVNAFFKMWKISFVLRKINAKAISMSELWLPLSASIFTQAKQGLLLVTGPTWSWKSTTMVSILDQINQTRWEHIITIEDPIEFVFTDNKSIFSQREVGRDTNSFHIALRAAMREDPDIIMVWEMRDEETVKTALELAETGHLVISTMHTSGSVQTITRLINFFPSELQNSIQDKLADNLVGVISQRLIPKANQSWRVGIFELMFMTTSIKNLIRLWKLEQIEWYIETGMKQWMISMKKYADIMRDKWLILEKDYEMYFREDDIKK